MAKGKERANQDEDKEPTLSEALASAAAAVTSIAAALTSSAAALTSAATALTSAADALNSYASTNDDTQCENSPTKEGVLKLFREFKARRDGIVRALTTDVERFYRSCDPGECCWKYYNLLVENIYKEIWMQGAIRWQEKLCLYGLVDGSWRVKTPVKLVPADMPEPTVGFNFVRDDWNRKEWLAKVAMHSDAWLYQTAFFKRHKLEEKSRKELFNMINNLPTIYEVVMEAAKKPSNERTPENSKRNKSASELMPPAKRPPKA